MSDFFSPGPAQVFSEEERFARLRLARSRGIGPVTFQRLVERFASAVAALEALKQNVAIRKSITLATRKSTEEELRALSKAGLSLVFSRTAPYPPLLAQIHTAPPVITVGGDMSLLQRPAIAMVGARNASALSLRFARKLAADLGEAGHTIISGMARGIDAAAHEASLATGTAAVMAGGLKTAFPPENMELFKKIRTHGAVISERPFAYQAQGRDFPRRNRIISGCAHGLIVVEAAVRSGSLLSARYALEQGREVFAVPGSPLDPRARGTNGLIKDGAILIQNAEDVLSALERPSLVQEHKQQPAAGPRTEEMDSQTLQEGKARLLDLLGAAPVDKDTLMLESGLESAQTALLLLELLLEGKIIEDDPGQFRKVSP